MAAGVKVEPIEPELLASLQLVDKGTDRDLSLFRVGVPQVDQIGVVRENLSGGKTEFIARLAKLVNLALRQRRSSPLPLVLGKKSKGSCSNLRCIARSLDNTARSTHMCTDIFHSDKIPIARVGEQIEFC